ncbi:hypothetical protein AtubIFM57258_008258 [Aspergillus tubingensis]|nr:hypothetical protein AtubIFM57258_008258 [Aspergillus tubingensis]
MELKAQPSDLRAQQNLVPRKRKNMEDFAAAHSPDTYNDTHDGFERFSDFLDCPEDETTIGPVVEETIERTVGLTEDDEASEPLTEYSTDSGDEQQKIDVGAHAKEPADNVALPDNAVEAKQGSETLCVKRRSERIAQRHVLNTDATCPGGGFCMLTVAESATEGGGQKETESRICHTRHIAVDSLNHHELVNASTGAWFCHTILGNTYQRMQCVERLKTPLLHSHFQTVSSSRNGYDSN